MTLWVDFVGSLGTVLSRYGFECVDSTDSFVRLKKDRIFILVNGVQCYFVCVCVCRLVLDWLGAGTMRRKTLNSESKRGP